MDSRALRQRAPGLWTAESQADAEIPKFLRKYDFSTRMTVIVAHGDIINTSGKRMLRDAYSFVLSAGSRMRGVVR